MRSMVDNGLVTRWHVGGVVGSVFADFVDIEVICVSLAATQCTLERVVVKQLEQSLAPGNVASGHDLLMRQTFPF